MKPPGPLFFLRLMWMTLIDFLRVVARGPACMCGETAWSEKRAIKQGWRWTTWYDGGCAWVCSHCLKNGSEPTQY